MHHNPSYRRIGIIGTGRVAQAMTFALASHSAAPILVWGRSAARRDALVAHVDHSEAAQDLTAIASTCDLILIAVSDDAIAAVVSDLATVLPETEPFILHMSGRSGVGILAPLAQRGAIVAAVHPVMTFTGDARAEVARMVGAYFVITGTTSSAIQVAEHVVACLGGVTERVEEAQRALYHAALCHASNHLVTLIAGSIDALKVAGIADPSALIAPLVQAALGNSLDRGMAGLSGPLLRGDADTIGGHVAAIAADCPPLLPAYRAMAMATLDALERAGDTSSALMRRILT
jgi:predicted short-subunit dehydrogenase-like oxidoreductase (DUF2520 family)